MNQTLYTEFSKEQLIEELTRLKNENTILNSSLDRAMREIDELNALHEAAVEGIMLHEKGVLLKANNRYYNMFVYKPEELQGKQALPLTVIPETMDLRKRRETPNETASYEIQGLRKDRSTFPLEVRGKLMEFQGRTVRGIALMDITDRKEVEDALRESEKMLRFLSTRLFEAQEQERTRLSKELHDQLGHDLVLLKLCIRSIQKKLDESQTELQKECDDTIAAVDQIIENVRRISRDLMPSILEDLGIMASLQSLLENFSKQHGIQVQLEMEEFDRIFPREIQIHLYRIIQEVLTNVSKHSAANSIYVDIKRSDKNILFQLIDNGKGFDLSKVMERKFDTRGVGLTAMKERIFMMGGQFEVKSYPGEGTEIKFQVPIGTKEE